MDNSDVKFTTKFRLDLSPKRVVITDTIDYSGIGENPADFKGVLMISGPTGVIYNNTDFSNSDIDPGVSKESTTQINLPLDPENNYEVRHGEYTVKYTVQKTTTEDEYYSSDVYDFSFNEPTMAVDVDSGPYSAKLRSDDETDYGSNISLLTREHRIQYPTDLGFSDIVVTTASHEVDPIYTNEWTTIITSTVDYKQGDDLEYKWYGTKTVTHCVTGACISSFYSSVDEMLTMYQGYIGVNPNRAGVFRERLQQINTAWQLLDIAWMYIDYEEADKQSEIIRELIESSGIDLCPSGLSIQVEQCPEWGGGQGGGFYTPGTGIHINVAGKVISLSHLGFEDLADPGADKILFWDNTAGKVGWTDLEGKIKVSSNDTVSDYLEGKFSVSHGVNSVNILELSTLGEGSDETLQLQLDESKISHDSIAGVSADDHHNQAHVLATSGPHTGALPLTDLDNYAAGALMYGGAADWAVLAKGTAGKVLKMGADYPAWATLVWTDISDTLANLNTAVTDATLIDTGDARLSDARTPTAHASSHLSSGGDTIANFTSTVSGLVPLSGGGTTKYLRADATWVVPPGGGGGIVWTNEGSNRVGTYVDANTINAEVNLTFNGSILEITGNVVASAGIKAVAGFLAGASEYHVFHEGDEIWQTDTGGNFTWNFNTSRNMKWTSSTSGTLIISNMPDGATGVLICYPSADIVLTFPANSNLTTLSLESAADYILTVVKDGTDYIWFANSIPVGAI